MLWHYPQKYTVVSVTRSPLFESDITYEQPCCPYLCLSARPKHFCPFSSKSTTPKPDLPSQFALLFLPLLWVKKTCFKVLWVFYQSYSDMMMFPTLARSTPLLSSVISKQAFDIVYPFCLSWGLQGLSAGADRWISQPQGRGKRWAREKQCYPSLSILYDSQICHSMSYGMANFRPSQRKTVSDGTNTLRGTSEQHFTKASSRYDHTFWDND